MIIRALAGRRDYVMTDESEKDIPQNTSCSQLDKDKEDLKEIRKLLPNSKPSRIINLSELFNNPEVIIDNEWALKNAKKVFQLLEKIESKSY